MCLSLCMQTSGFNGIYYEIFVGNKPAKQQELGCIFLKIFFS